MSPLKHTYTHKHTVKVKLRFSLYFFPFLALQNITFYWALTPHLYDGRLFFATLILYILRSRQKDELVLKCCAPLVPQNAGWYIGSRCSRNSPVWSFDALIVYVCMIRFFLWIYTPASFEQSSETVRWTVEAVEVFFILAVSTVHVRAVLSFKHKACEHTCSAFACNIHTLSSAHTTTYLGGPIYTHL